MILDSPIISGSLTQQAGQTAEIPRYTAVSSSFLAASASFDARIDSIESTTASLSPRINALESFTASANGTYVNVSGDSMSGDLTITGSLIVTDRITAQEFHTEYVSSSVVFQSGSTKFGNSEDDVHSFTGSVQIDGNVIASNLEGVFSSSAQITGSLGNYYIVSGTITQTTWDNIANKPGGIVSSSNQLTESLDSHYIVSGTITQTTWDNIENKPSGIVSGAAQVTESLDLRYRLVGDDITFAELTFKPTLISGSSQLDGTTIQNLSGSFSGSFSGSYRGDGSGLTGLAAGAKFHTQSTPAATWTFIHNLSTQYPNVTVYDSNNNIVLPQSITATNANTLILEFGGPVAGYATAGIGGIIEVNGRTIKQYFASSLEWRFEHNFGDRFANIQTYDSNYEKIIPQTIVLTDTTSSLITFPEVTEGWAIGTIGGDLPAISSSYGGYTLQVSQTAPYTASWTPAADVLVTNAVNAETASYLNSFSQSLIPAVSGTYDLGSVDKPFRHIYVGTGSIYLVDNTGNIVKTLTGDSIVTNDNLSSLNEFTASNFTTNTFTSSATARLNSIETISASNIARLNTLEEKTGSLATTGSNTFYGTQVFSGSLYVQDNLIVQGSSSLQNITASAVSIGTNIVSLNTATPSVRYAGLTVQDSGSSAGVTGSMLWDSLCNRWIYSNPSTIGYSGGMLLSGPRASTLGTETTLTCNYVAKSGGGDHLYDSAIWESGSSVGIGTSTLIADNARMQLLIGGNTFGSVIGMGNNGSATKFLIENDSSENVLFINKSNTPIIFYTNNTRRLDIKDDGVACFSSMVCAPTIRVATAVCSCASTTLYGYFDGSSTVLPNPTDRPHIFRLANGGLGISANNEGVGSQPIRFYTCGTERFTILSNGCVGIRATNPRATLHVQQGSNDGTPSLGTARDGTVFTANNGNYGLNLTIDPSGDTIMQAMRFDGSAIAYNVLINPSGGKVGIGKSPSSAFLDITGGNDGDAMISIGSNSVSGILNTPSNLYINADSDNNSASGQIQFGFNRMGYTGGLAGLTITESGQIGVGQMAPSAWVSPFNVIQGGYYGQHVGFQTNGADMKLGSNNYYFGAGYNYTCSNYGAVQLNVGASSAGGYFSVNAAPSGTAGQPITFVERFNVSADGSVNIDASGTGTRSYIRMGRFSNSVTNSGEAWLGRASDRGVGQMTVQLGSSNNNTFEVVNHEWSRVAFYVNGNGNYDFAGSDLSDRRQKCNIQYIEDTQICNIMKLKSASFNKKNGVGGINDNVHTGFIAQDVLESNIPNLVHGTDEDGYGLDYNGILSLAVKAIQEQQCTIDTLKSCLGIN
jgi:hypothetical protein